MRRPIYVCPGSVPCTDGDIHRVSAADLILLWNLPPRVRVIDPSRPETIAGLNAQSLTGALVYMPQWGCDAYKHHPTPLTAKEAEDLAAYLRGAPCGRGKGRPIPLCKGVT